MRLPTGILLSLLLAGSLTLPGTVLAGKRHVVELERVAPRVWRLDGVEYDADALAAKLAELDQAAAIRKLVLVDPEGRSSMGDVIDVALFAKPIKAKAYHQVRGELREINVKIR